MMTYEQLRDLMITRACVHIANHTLHPFDQRYIGPLEEWMFMPRRVWRTAR